MPDVTNYNMLQQPISMTQHAQNTLKS